MRDIAGFERGIIGGTALKPCSCTHRFQDRQYGLGMRVFNAMTKERSFKGWRCTVCQREIRA